jgi:hypothetical protein
MRRSQKTSQLTQDLVLLVKEYKERENSFMLGFMEVNLGPSMTKEAILQRLVLRLPNIVKE